MKLSAKGRYAVMAMVDLAGADSPAPVALAAIAERQEISLSYLEQLFGKLRRHGLVHAVRGPGGGYRLARPAAEIRIADIVIAVDESLAATRCRPGTGDGCRRDRGRCATHALWEALGDHIYLFLSSISLADVCAHRIPGRGAPAAVGLRVVT